MRPQKMLYEICLLILFIIFYYILIVCRFFKGLAILIILGIFYFLTLAEEVIIKDAGTNEDRHSRNRS